MKGTRLWQDTGSPLISGRSRRQRPFWQPWLLAGIMSSAVVVAWISLVARVPVWSISAATLLVVALAGAACGVWLSRLAGWSWPWIVGAVSGVVCAALVLAIAGLPMFSAMRLAVS